MLYAFLDESGIHGGAPVCVVAGFFGGKGQWRRFGHEWRSALGKHGLALKDFHAKEFCNRSHPFSEKQMGKGRYEALEDGLVAAITGHKIHPCSFAIVVGDFEALPLSARRFFTGAQLRKRVGRVEFTSSGCPSKPYFVPFSNCIRAISGHAPRGGKAHFAFGLGRPFAEYAASLYGQIVGDPLSANWDRLGSISFPEAGDTPGLQAADLLSYLTFRHVQGCLRRSCFGGSVEAPLSRLLLRTLLLRDHAYQDFEALEATLRRGIERIPELDLILREVGQAKLSGG